MPHASKELAFYVVRPDMEKRWMILTFFQIDQTQTSAYLKAKGFTPRNPVEIGQISKPRAGAVPPLLMGDFLFIYHS